MSRYDFLRKRIAPIAFFAAIALIAKDSCDKNKRTHTAVELEFGNDRAEVRAVDVEVYSGSEQVSRFHREALPGSMIGPCRFQLALADEDIELRIDVDRGAAHQQLTRRVHVIEGSTTLIAIPPGAAPPP